MYFKRVSAQQVKASLSLGKTIQDLGLDLNEVIHNLETSEEQVTQSEDESDKSSKRSISDVETDEPNTTNKKIKTHHTKVSKMRVRSICS